MLMLNHGFSTLIPVLSQRSHMLHTVTVTSRQSAVPAIVLQRLWRRAYI